TLDTLDTLWPPLASVTLGTLYSGGALCACGTLYSGGSSCARRACNVTAVCPGRAVPEVNVARAHDDIGRPCGIGAHIGKVFRRVNVTRDYHRGSVVTRDTL